VRGDIVPVPVRQAVEPQPTVVVASAVVALLARRADTPDQNRLEASVPLNAAFPVFEPANGFLAPRHDASKRGAERAANYQSLGDWNRCDPLPIAGARTAALGNTGIAVWIASHGELKSLGRECHLAAIGV
jgi:hypothetical protein